MARKQINFPIGLIPSWANNANMSDPGEPWDGTPTKVEPGAGKRDLGYLAEETPTAQELNHKLNELGKWVQYLSCIQVMNWFDCGEPVAPGMAQQTAECICYDEGLLGFVIAGRANEVSFTGDGFTFSDIGPTGSAQTWTWAASKRPDQSPTHTGANTVLTHNAAQATPNIEQYTSGGWATTTGNVSGGLDQIVQHVWDEDNERWIFVGCADTGGTPQPYVCTSVDPLAAALTVRGVSAATNSDRVVLIAVNLSGLSVLVGNTTMPFDVWTSTNAVTFTRATPVGITAGQEARALIWDDSRNVFVLLTTDEVYTSTDGVNWTQIAVLVANEFKLRAFACDGGGLYVAATAATAHTSIRYSYDGGLTWRLVKVPPSESGGAPGTEIDQICYSRGHGRFAATWVQGGANPGNLTVSLAVGETMYGIDSISVPEVT